MNEAWLSPPSFEEFVPAGHPAHYAERHRAGLRVGTALPEGTANFQVDRRMAKSQQMRWSRGRTALLLQVRCAVDNGAFGSCFGQRFEPAPGPGPRWAQGA